jgi:molybdate transport system substrate-binding protein
MAGQWLRFFAGATLTLSVAGHALAEEGKVTVLPRHRSPTRCRISPKSIKKKNVEVVSSFASSSTLARQIEAGAPADLFISADQKWMDYAVEKKSIDTASRATCSATAWLSWRQKPARRAR